MKRLNVMVLPILYCSFVFFSHINANNPRPPKLTIVIVVDQFAYHHINKLYPHFKYGFKYLLNNGVVYTNAHMPHGKPGTAMGHAGLNTGTYAKNHGFVSNGWYSSTGEEIDCDDDASENTQVIIPNEDNAVYDGYGKSAHMLMVDGLSDQCVMQSTPLSEFRSFSISGKSRSAIATASKLGKAIWFDANSGLFTSSKAYFQELPDWLRQFNNTHDLNDLGTIIWNRMYPKSPHAYSFFDINNYEFSRRDQSMLNHPIPIPDLAEQNKPYHFYERTPLANKRILDLAQVCIKNNVSRKTKDRLLLWVCLSPLDKLSHQYGPHTIDVIDMIYHLDKQLQKFMRFALKAVGKHNVVFALTADHGVMPIPELLHSKGLSFARRLLYKKLIEPLNEYIEQKYNIPHFVTSIMGSELIFDHSVMAQLSEEQQQQITEDIRSLVLQNPVIKNAWLFDELLHLNTEPNTPEDYLKNQLYRGRSGQIIVQSYPYNLFTDEAKGTSHSTPYGYDTHVPLILFHSGKFERKQVRQRVTTLQLASTLAELLNVSKPSASSSEVLPELFDPEYQ